MWVYFIIMICVKKYSGTRVAASACRKVVGKEDVVVTLGQKHR